MAYQAWNTGDTVSAAAFTYIADAVINVFATETARDAAITSATDGQFAYTTTTPADTLSYYNGSAWVAVDLAGDITGLTAGTLIDITAATGPVPTVNVDLSEASTSTSDADGDYFLVTDAASAQYKLTKANIALSGMNNDSGWTTNTGDVTGVTAGTNIDVSSATGPVPTVNLAIDAALVTGSDGSGVDVTMHSTTAGDYSMFDASAAQWILEGTNGTTALDVSDGNVVIGDGTLSVSGAITATGGVTGNVTGTAATVTGAAQSAITSVGTLSSLDVTGALTAGSLVAPLAINAQTGTTYTFVLADAGKLVTSSNGSAQTITVPPNSGVAFAIGTQIIVQNIGSANATLATAGTPTLNSKDANLEIDGQFAAATLIKTATDAWSIIGALA